MRVLSFGYRYPRTDSIGADIVLDARCLKEDPAQHEALHALSGLDEPVRDYLQSLPDVQAFMGAGYQAANALDGWKDGAVLAVGCHSGRHRSVYIASVIAERMGVKAEHLDMDRPVPTVDDAPDFV